MVLVALLEAVVGVEVEGVNPWDNEHSSLTEEIRVSLIP